MKKLFIVLLLLTFAVPGFSQKDFRPGYIVQGTDTLKGFVDYRGDKKNAMVCQFKTTGNRKEDGFGPAQLMGYGYADGKHYESHVIKTSKGYTYQVFLNVLVKGKASLMFYRDSAGTDQFYLMKGNKLELLEQRQFTQTDPKTGLKTKVTENIFLKTLAANFSDCPSVYQQIQKTAFKTSSLMKVTEAYNQCAESGGSTYVKKVAPSKLTTGAVLGVHAAFLKIDSETYLGLPEKYRSGFKPHFGLFLNYSIPALNEKLSLQADLLLVKNRFNETFTKSIIGDQGYHYNVEFDLLYLKMPVQIRYMVPKGKIKPFFNVGVLAGYALKNNRMAIFTSDFGGPRDRIESIPLPGKAFRKYTYAFTGGIGGMSHIFPNHPLTMEFRYETSNGFSDALAIPTSIGSFYLNLGYQF